MDPRRVPPRTVSDPRIRQVGFFAPPDRTQSGPPDPTSSSPPVSGNSLSPVMIPPSRHLSADLSRAFHSPLRSRRPDSIPVGSYNPSEFTSPDKPHSPVWSRNAKFATSLPAAGFDTSAMKQNDFPSTSLTTVSTLDLPPPVAEKDRGVTIKAQKDRSTNSKPKPVKEKTTTKAERRAMQEAQRAAKAAAKAEGSKTQAPAASNANSGKAAKGPSLKKEIPPVASSEKRVGDRAADKDRKTDVPHLRMQFDDENRVERVKKRSVVNQTEARNRVGLFRHLPQYEHGTRLPELQSKFFQLDSVHPAVYKVGLRYLAGDVSGGNARCIAMLQAFQESIKDYSTPPEKALIRDLTARINSFVSFLIEFRPLSISMGNAIRFVKTRIAKLPLTLSESEAKATLISEIDRFISEKIILADKVIVKHAVTKIRDGDVLLTYGSSSAVEMLLLHAHELGKQFRVVVVDSRPKLEGRLLLRRLVRKGISCTYAHINAVSYIMHDVTRVFLGASAVLCNGTVYSRVGTAGVAMVAHQFRVPILICCEAYKFHERVQLDSICSNELGDPDAIAKIPGRKESNCLDDCSNRENLQLLNLVYDVTPSDYVSMIITDYGMIPPTSVPAIVREYCREHLWT